ncbi:hypothetical protein PCYB_041960 [Plasmodium cynomolgi strain B]|uniref:50S ribosomal protein L33 n=1 Tax=Plasmodium cynomolgi (strain B) TaxID=1120755 RepID=K6UQB8_PLACD|nr:hypothetical protein PCYB_041960 [Plasmodium cynomolgi strain B]GAB64994.1 hypothetical protein PCYB_041960 [Plasmodium cynomolgi strain B]
MFFLSSVLFRSKSKRVHVNLISSCASNYIYSTYISPSKSKFRMSLRKHDPVVNRHVFVPQPSAPRVPSVQRRVPIHLPLQPACTAKTCPHVHTHVQSSLPFTRLSPLCSMFYQKHTKSKSKKRLTMHGINYARFTGKNKNLRPLLKRVEKSYLFGKFNKLIDNTYR